MAPGQARTGPGQSSPGFLPRIYWDDPAVSSSCAVSFALCLLLLRNVSMHVRAHWDGLDAANISRVTHFDITMLPNHFSRLSIA